MKLIKDKTQEFTAVSLHIVRIKNTELPHENLFWVNCFDFVKIRPVHHLNSRLEISAKFHEFDQKLLFVEILLIFTYNREHVEKCGAGYERL